MPESINFTKAGLMALPVGEKRYHVYDKKIGALGVTVHPSGRKAYHIRCTVNGKTERIGIGAYPDMPVELARKSAQKELAKVASGINPISERKGAREAKEQEKVLLDLTVMKAVDEFCLKQRKGSTEKPLKPKTIHDYKWGIRKFLGSERYEGPLVALTRQTISECYESRLEQSKSRAANEMRSLSSVWNWILNQDDYEGQVPDNPIAQVKAKRKLYKAPPKKGRLIVKGELNELAEWLDEVEKLEPVEREFFEWLLFTGNRLGEVMALDWQDLNFKTSEYRLEDPKNREAVDLPIPGYLKTRLKARKKRKGIVFPVNHLGRAARERVGQAIDKQWTNHDLRRTFSGIAQSSGIPYTSVKRLMNHAYSDITEIYIGDSADLHQELEQVERKILELAGRTPDNLARLELVR